MTARAPSSGRATALPPKPIEARDGDFDLVTFTQSFEVLAEARGGIAHLRSLVRSLSVRGLLGGGPASRWNEVVEGHSFPLPAGWRWCRLEEIADLADGPFGSKLKSAHYISDPGFRVLRLGNVGMAEFKGDDRSFVTRQHFHSLASYHLYSGDILVASLGNPPGRACLIPDDALPALNKADCFRVRVTDASVSTAYLVNALNSDYVLARALSLHRGDTRGRITVKHLRGTPIALPPLAEQERVLAEVDQLMALCDELEARQAKRREIGTQLTKAALSALGSADTPAELGSAWGRVVENFDVLVDRQAKLRTLRETILRLAVRGRLEPQMPGDSPSCDIVEAVRSRRSQLMQKRRVSSVEDLAPVRPADMPFTAPSSWAWVRLGTATICRDGERVPVPKEERLRRPGPYDYYGASGVIDSIDGFLFDGPLLLIGEDGANLLSRTTPIAFVASGKFWVNNHAHVLDGLDADMLRYVALYLNATDLAPYVTGTAQPKLNQAKMNLIPVALPPREEQRRIVAKVEQLMALCDELEAHLAQAEDLAAGFATAATRAILAPPHAL